MPGRGLLWITPTLALASRISELEEASISRSTNQQLHNKNWSLAVGRLGFPAAHPIQQFVAIKDMEENKQVCKHTIAC